MSQKVNQIIQQKAYLHSKDKEHNPEKHHTKTKKQSNKNKRQTNKHHHPTKQNKTQPEQKIPLTFNIWSRLCNSAYDKNSQKKNPTEIIFFP